jgi:hypothetical protein
MFGKSLLVFGSEKIDMAFSNSGLEMTNSQKQNYANDVSFATAFTYYTLYHLMCQNLRGNAIHFKTTQMMHTVY